MTMLEIRRVDAPDAIEEATRDGARIAQLLGAIGVRFERWSAGRAHAPDASADDILAAYAAEIDRLRRDGGYQSVDVIRVPRGAPDAAELRAKFLNEHRHAEDEVRFFVEGGGSFYLRTDDRVFQVACTRDDLIAVPAGTRHWFDMGARPGFCAIRLFVNPDGWVARFTGDPIAARFPSHDDVVGPLA